VLNQYLVNVFMPLPESLPISVNSPSEFSDDLSKLSVTSALRVINVTVHCVGDSNRGPMVAALLQNHFEVSEERLKGAGISRVNVRSAGTFEGLNLDQVGQPIPENTKKVVEEEIGKPFHKTRESARNMMDTEDAHIRILLDQSVIFWFRENYPDAKNLLILKELDPHANTLDVSDPQFQLPEFTGIDRWKNALKEIKEMIPGLAEFILDPNPEIGRFDLSTGLFVRARPIEEVSRPFALVGVSTDIDYLNHSITDISRKLEKARPEWNASVNWGNALNMIVGWKNSIYEKVRFFEKNSARFLEISAIDDWKFSSEKMRGYLSEEQRKQLDEINDKIEVVEKDLNEFDQILRTKIEEQESKIAVQALRSNQDALNGKGNLRSM
jgi:protein-tyrosine-phosphatase